MTTMRTVADFVLFQLAWLACVELVARGQPAFGIAAVATFVVLQLARSPRRAADALLVALALVLGFMWDTGLLQAGLVHYAAQGPVAGVAPAWILALWALFAVVLRGPLRWLLGKPLWAAALGAVGGPASYLAAARLGACTLPQPVESIAVLAVGWALFTPLLFEVARRLDDGAAPLEATRS